MKKTYTNPAAHTADVKIRASLLQSSSVVNTGVNNNPVSGTPDNPISGGARERSTSTLD
jgi:hypothetical protein